MTTRLLTHEGLLRLANALSASSTLPEWCEDLRDVLGPLLPTVDRISVNFNRGASLTDDLMADDAISGSHILDRLSKRHSLVLTAGRERDAEHFADKFRQAGLPVNDYRKPVCLSFHGASGSYIGSLILWTKATSPPIDTATVAHLEALRPFFAYVFTSALARFSLTNMQFFNTLHSIISLTASSDLSRREREVLMCRFNGMSAAATAALLHISSSTVRRHLREMNKVLQDSHTLTRVLGSPIPPRTRRSKKKQTAYPPMISNR